MSRFQPFLSAIAFCLASVPNPVHAYNFNASDEAQFKSNFKTSCLQANATVFAVLTADDFATMCDCTSDRVLSKIRGMPDSEFLPLLDANSEESKKKWSAMGREASMVCGSKPFASAMQKVIMKACTSGQLKSQDGASIMPAQRCDCISKDFAEHYTLGNVSGMSDQNATNRFAQQAMFNAQKACTPK